MKSKVVAILETRTGAHLGELIARRGGIPVLAPALEEVPEVDSQAVASLLARWQIDPFKIVIFQTGVGTRALFQATDAAGLDGGRVETLAVLRGGVPRTETWRRIERARRAHRHTGRHTVHHGNGLGGGVGNTDAGCAGV